MNKKPRVIALVGRAGVGKSTVARILNGAHGARIVSLDGPLGRMVSHLIPQFAGPILYGNQEQRERVDPGLGFSPRTFMQELGHSARKEIGEDVWINAAMNTIHRLYKEDPNRRLFVIDGSLNRYDAALVWSCPEIDGRVVQINDPDGVWTPGTPSHGPDKVPLLYISWIISNGWRNYPSDRPMEALIARVSDAFHGLFSEDD